MKLTAVKVLSLFNGVSCGRVALERANIPVLQYTSYEIDKYANQVAKDNYPNDTYLGDVTTADFTQYQDIDLLIGGSPCTYWSIAKKDREITSDGIGFELFSHYVRALHESKPKYFIYENNYSIHKDIKAEITKTLGVEPIMINSALVSAQNRKRCYWTNIPNIQQPIDKGILLKDIICNDETYIYVPAENLNHKKYGKNYMQYDINNRGNNSQDQRAFYLNNKMCCIVSSTSISKCKIIDENGNVRMLTRNEFEKLQTLPINYTKCVSKNTALKGIGNGWTIGVIAHILSYIPRD